jgi:hypothetical protein
MVYLPKGSIMKWNGNSITEHNRDAVSVDIERIGSSDRMANGTLRKWVVADKRTFTTSWSNLPVVGSRTVDGKWGGAEIMAFYLSTPGAFTLTIHNTVDVETYVVHIKDFGRKIVRRAGTVDFWDIDISLEEV